MNIWNHSRISVRKFGGIEEDYFEIHKFIDSSKLFYFHAKHRLLLHNLYGISIVIKKFGDTIKNSNNQIILVRDIAAEHLKEDLSGKVPSLNEWLIDNDEEISKQIKVPKISDSKLEEFVLTPLIMSNLKSSLLITLSDFGIYLTNEILGIEYAKELINQIEKEKTVKNYLEKFKFTQQWQFCPDKKELEWLKNHKHGQ
jgi:hypothetical protein